MIDIKLIRENREFDFEILEECSKELLNEREKYWIEYYDSYHHGYNASPGGDNCGERSDGRPLLLYDLNGNFVFQEIKNYLNTTPATTYLNERNNIFRTLNKNDYLVDRSKGITAYKFSNKNIITSYANTPQYNMIKNDFVVWGIRKTLDGLEFPIRYHLAIDSKPKLTDEIFSIYFEVDEEDGYNKPFLPQRIFSQKDFKCNSEEV